jgi:heat shock protein HslJ
MVIMRSTVAITFVAFTACARAPDDPGDGGASEAPDETSEVVPGGGASSPLAGTVWRLQDIAGEAVLPDVEATIQFEDGGRVSGRASCNQFGGSASVSGESITFEPLILTRMACQDSIMAQEDRYVEALQAAQRFTVNGDELLMYSSAEGQPLRFRRTT